MAITRVGGSWIHKYVSLVADDVTHTYTIAAKPELNLPNGSRCFEMDSDTEYIYDRENDAWEVYVPSGGGSGGTTNYNQLSNKPSINNVELSGNKTLAALGIDAGSIGFDETETYDNGSVGKEVSDAKNAISEIAPRLDDYPKYAGYIDSNLWKSIGSGDNQYTIIPVNSGDKINIHAPSTGDTVIAALKTYSSPTTDTSPDFSETTGWTSTVRIYANQTKEFEAPSDANYLYMFLGAKPTYPRKPTSFIVNGYDIAGTMVDQLGELLLRVDSIEDIAVVSDGIKDLSKYPVLTGWIDNSANPQVWKIANFSNIIPVNGGEKIEIIAPTTSNYRVAYAALKTFTGVVKDSTPDFSSAEGWNAVRYVEVTNGFIGQLPDDARYLYLYRGNSTTYNRTPISLVIGGYDIIKPFGNNIGNKVSKNGAVPTIRFMQWNIGAFDYGRKPSTGNPAGMSDEQYAEKLPKYREFFCKYKPEILCMQECLQYVDKNHNHESDDVLFNDILPYSAKSGELRIKSIFPIVEYGTGSVAGVSVSVPYLMAILNVYGKHVAVFTTTLDYVASANGYANRAQQFASLLSVASQYEYAIICGDINCSGNGSDITSRDEAIELVSYAETVGWEGCNGGYLGWYVTHYDTQNTLDNILYKDNSTEIFRNFKVLSDEYENVSSDHYALIADIAIN